MKTLVVFSLSVLLVMSASAEMYKWVDDKGKVHFGDSVPVKYQQKADTLNTFKGPTDQQKSEAQQAAARTKALAHEYQYRSAEKQAVETMQRAQEAEASGEKKQASSKTGKKGCAQKLKRFHDSSSCFNNYRNANGSLKAAAYKKCKNVSRPDECF